MLCCAPSGGERSPIYIVFLTTALDVGLRVTMWQAGGIALVAAFAYTLAAWGASLGGVYSFDTALAATRGFLFVAAALTSSSLSQTANLARVRAAEANALNKMMRLAMATALDMPAVLRAIVQEVCVALQADCGIVCLRGEHGETIENAVFGLDVPQSEAVGQIIAGGGRILN